MKLDIDRDRVLEKVAFIREQVGDIQTLLLEKDSSEILNDKLLLKGIKYSLQTAIEAMIDIAFHVVAKKYNSAPQEARDAFRILRKNGIIEENDYLTFSAMVGFRNRMVNLYQTISDERVFEFSTSKLDDFEAFIDRIMVVLEQNN